MVVNVQDECLGLRLACRKGPERRAAQPCWSVARTGVLGIFFEMLGLAAGFSGPSQPPPALSALHVQRAVFSVNGHALHNIKIACIAGGSLLQPGLAVLFLGVARVGLAGAPVPQSSLAVEADAVISANEVVRLRSCCLPRQHCAALPPGVRVFGGGGRGGARVGLTQPSIRCTGNRSATLEAPRGV